MTHRGRGGALLLKIGRDLPQNTKTPVCDDDRHQTTEDDDDYTTVCDNDVLNGSLTDGSTSNACEFIQNDDDHRDPHTTSASDANAMIVDMDAIPERSVSGDAPSGSKFKTCVVLGLCGSALSFVACVLFFFTTELCVFFLNGKTIIHRDNDPQYVSKYDTVYDQWSPKSMFMIMPLVFVGFYSLHYVLMYVYLNNFKTLFYYAMYKRTCDERSPPRNITKELKNILKHFSMGDNDLFGLRDEGMELDDVVSANPLPYTNDPVTYEYDANAKPRDTGGTTHRGGRESVDFAIRDMLLCGNKCCRERVTQRVKYGVFLTASTACQWVFVKFVVYSVFGGSWYVDSRNGMRLSDYVFFGYTDAVILGYLFVSTLIVNVAIHRAYLNIGARLYSRL